MSEILTSELKIRLTGIRPLLMARGEVANPFDPQSRAIKAVSQKKKKTDEDYQLLARLQFESSMYYDEKIGPYIPVDNLWKCMQQGAAKYKESGSVKSQVVIRGFVGKELDPGAAKLIYDGPSDLEGLYQDGRFMFLKMGKLPATKTSVLTSRARFEQWKAEFLVEYAELEKTRIMDYWAVSGRFVGIGAWRPQHGLFHAEVIK